MKKFIIVSIILVITAGLIIFLVQRKKQSGDGASKDSFVEDIQQNVDTETSTAQFESLKPYFGEFEHDKDRDGIQDTKEKELGLSDEKSDTDGDGLNDSAEINTYKTDPKKKDTDGDGYADGYEVLKGFNPNGGGKFETQQ